MDSLWRNERLRASHRRDQFDCGQPSLDNFLRARAMQYERRDLARTYVLVRDDDWQVQGYFTLACGSLKPALLPTKWAKKLPEHPVPVALLGRFAIHRRWQGQGVGRMLLLDALARCAKFAQQIGIALVEVHAIDESARSFYGRFGFQPLEDSWLHLYLPIDHVPRELTEAAD